MKKIFILAFCFAVTLSAIAQKKELKKVAKLVKSDKLEEAFIALEAVKGLVEGTKYESQYHYLRGKRFLGKNENENHHSKALKEFNTVLDIETIAHQDNFSEKAIESINSIYDFYLDKAIKSIRAQNFEASAQQYEKLSKLIPERRDVLRNALFSYRDAENYPKTIMMLEELLKKEQASNIYTAFNVHTKKMNEFFTKESMDKAVSLKTHMQPQETGYQENIRADVYYASLAGLYLKEKNKEKALEVLDSAKKEFPTKVNFFRDHAAIVYGMNDKNAYLKSLDEVLSLTPNDSQSWFNYGVVSQELGMTSKAIEAYDKTTIIDPGNRGAYINKALVILSKEQTIIDELNNSRGNSKKRNAAKDKMKEMYLAAIAAFEKANEIKEDPAIISNLILMYKEVGQTEKAKALE